MQYFLDLFTPETWRAFCATDRTVTGFRPRQKRVASERVKKGDILMCYLTRLSRWCGALEVASEVYQDDRLIHGDPDPFTVRFSVKPIVILEMEASVPILDRELWNTLTLTNKYEFGYQYWSGFFRNSLNVIPEGDGNYLLDILRKQEQTPKAYPFTENDHRKLERPKKVRTLDGEIEVEIPDDLDEHESSEGLSEDSALLGSIRESIRIQAMLAEIGTKMKMQIWVPRADRVRVMELVPSSLHHAFLNELPLNYEENTLKTIEQIDVLWLKGRSMVRAFEVEHTTAIYSGLLRMADLLALQPNMDIRLNIVAPEEKRDKVIDQIKRPIFSLLERRPLRDQCSFLSYDSVKILIEIDHLPHMNESIVEEYEEFAEV